MLPARISLLSTEGDPATPTPSWGVRSKSSAKRSTPAVAAADLDVSTCQSHPIHRMVWGNRPMPHAFGGMWGPERPSGLVLGGGLALAAGVGLHPH